MDENKNEEPEESPEPPRIECWGGLTITAPGAGVPDGE